MNSLHTVSSKNPQRTRRSMTASCRNVLRPLLASVALLAAPSTVPAQESGTRQSALRFVEAEAGSFTFDTGVLTGVLRQEGRSTGLVPITHKATGTAVAKGEGLFNHYRVFTQGKRYGYGARRWPSTAQLRADGSIEVAWPPTPERPFELKAHYRWAAPNTLDLITVVDAKAKLEAFEVVLASYFDSAFIDSRVWASRKPGGGAEAGFVAADRALGDWLAFPRNAAAAKIIGDGRWALEPSPLDWVHLPSFAHPVAIRRDPTSGITGMVMTRREDCFGVFTPYGTEKHTSNYFSVFGRDLEAGESARALSRLVVLPDWSEAKAKGIYKIFYNMEVPGATP